LFAIAFFHDVLQEIGIDLPWCGVIFFSAGPTCHAVMVAKSRQQRERGKAAVAVNQQPAGKTS
jgi:hypothetical protein